MVKLRDPLSQILEDAEEHEAASFTPLDVLEFFVPRPAVLKEKAKRRAQRRKK